MFGEKDPTATRPWYSTIYGLKDSAGNVVVPAKYFSFTLLGDDRIDVCQTWQEDDFYDAIAHGVIDLKGNFLLPCSIHHTQIETNDDGNRTLSVNFKDTYSPVLGKNSTALYDWNLNQLLPPKYNTISYGGDDCYILGINTGLASLTTSEPPQMGAYELGKGITIPLQYEGVTYIGSDRLCVRKQNMYCGAFTGDGKQTLPFAFADITAYQDGFYTAALFRNQQSFAAVQKQGLYANSYVALFQHSGNYIFDGWGYDVSTIPSYAVWGVIDENQNACTDFSYERIKFDGTTVRLGAWNGDHEYANPYSSIANAATGVLEKKYDYETKPISALNKTGETLTSLIQKSGVAVPDMPSNPSTSAPAKVSGFTDVKASDYYADAVLWAVNQKITSGTSATTFSPHST